ncbi:hypothetical protein DFH08DRAFT_858207 [Mycena albidolilacea]|uniref:Uncharacterized protein n=1 Tax=Mycena albidolilacea TaxID=1033008 RepID=A0AAD7EWP5_9AGAR|nr:hypothetical protein DFH08DRAFT_858207 [Mycena albidolilacea]
MTKSQAGHNNIGYRHINTITVDVHPPYLAPQEIRAGAKAQWVLTDLNMARFLELHVAGDENKYKSPVLKSLTEHLNERIIVGGCCR